MKAKDLERLEAIEVLRKEINPGDTVYTVLRNVSRSGMSRDIDCYILGDPGSDPRWISRLVARACGFSFNEKREAIRVGGCGMDMGFHVVYELSHALFPKGHGCTGEKCNSNDHSNGDRDYTPHGNGMTPHIREVLIGADHWHSEGGYALRHRWL